MYDTICTLPLKSELFTLSIHPTSPILALGLVTGHVQIHRLPVCSLIDGSLEPEPGHSTIETAWCTRRHKDSCRGLSFSPDGASLFSAGADGIVKAAATETGRVVSKIAVPLRLYVFVDHRLSILMLARDGLLQTPIQSTEAKNNETNHNCINYSHNPDPPTLIHALSSQSLLVATDSSALHIYDLRAPALFAAPLPTKTYTPHEDFISSLSPLAPSGTSTSGFSKQWVSTGGSTIAITDLRKGVLKNEDLGEELLSSLVLESGKIAVGGERGVLRIFESGTLEAENRVVMERGESLDALGRVPKGIGGTLGERVVVGMSNGRVKIVGVSPRKIQGEVRHDEMESVLGVGFEVGGRMISGGGSVLKVWQESSNLEAACNKGNISDENNETDEELEDNEEAEQEEDVAQMVTGLVNTGEDEESAAGEGEEGEEESSSEEAGRKRRKRRKRNKGRAFGGKGVLGFKGLD